MKKVIAVTALLVVVLAGVALLLPLALGSDTLRAALSRQLSEASDAEITLRGPIRFSIIPDFGIVAQDLGYVSGDGRMSATSERLVASVNLLSLLSDQIQVTGIELTAPRIVLASAGEGSEDAPAQEAEGDVFKLAAAHLQRLSFDRIEIIDGEIAENRDGIARPVASGVNLRLSVPGINEPASLAFSGTVNARKVDMAADIGSLRDLLERQPAEFSLSSTMEPPPHPALAKIAASGSIQLAADGSYRIEQGEIDSTGQTMRLDASYAPGDRPFIMARVGAGTLDYSDLQPAETTDAGASGASDRGPDLSALRGFDADIELRADALRVGEAVASGIVMRAELRDGKLNSTLNSREIAGGGLAASLKLDVNPAEPEASGSLNLASIDIQRLMTLAGRQAPVSGRLSSELGYAFIGLDAGAIRDSVNARGSVTVKEGIIDVPQLAEVAGSGASRVEALDLKAQITDISAPVAVSGTARWNGEPVGFATSLALTDILSGAPIAASVDFRSGPVNATFSGTLAPEGSVKGKVDIAAASLSRALGWFGQDTGTPLGRFSYSGQIAASSDRLALSEASIALDDMHANGSVSVAMAGKTTIEAALSVDTLDFGELTGSAGGSGEASAAAGPATIDLALLRQLDADIRLDARQIGFGEVKAGPASATLTIKDGVARLVVPEAGFYDGAVTANVIANGAGEIPAIEFAARLDRVSALPLLTDAAGFQRIEGRLTAEVAVKGSGADTTALARTLDGKAGAVFSDGALRGIDVAKLVNNIQSLIRSGYNEDAAGKTEFTELSVSLDIKDGVARTGDLRLLGPFVRMSGEGSIDLAQQTISMRLDPRVVGSLNGQGGDFDVSGLGMPVLVEGSLSGPRVYPDISGILANPQQALQMLSRLGGGVGGLATGVSGAADLIKDRIGADPGSVADGVVSGLIDQLGGGQAGGGAEGNTPDNSRDIVGSLLQGVLGRQAPGQQAPQEQIVQPAGISPGEVAEAPGVVPDGEVLVILPSENVPVPTPNPLRMAEAAPTPEPEAPKTLTDEVVDRIAPHIVPEGNEDAANDLIKGFIDRIGR